MKTGVFPSKIASHAGHRDDSKRGKRVAFFARITLPERTGKQFQASTHVEIDHLPDFGNADPPFCREVATGIGWAFHPDDRCCYWPRTSSPGRRSSGALLGSARFADHRGLLPPPWPDSCLVVVEKTINSISGRASLSRESRRTLGPEVARGPTFRNLHKLFGNLCGCRSIFQRLHAAGCPPLTETSHRARVPEQLGQRGMCLDHDVA